MIARRSRAEVRKMRLANALVADVLSELQALVAPE